MKKTVLAKFSANLVLKQSNQERYFSLLKEVRQNYANNQRYLFPNDLTLMFKVMRMVEFDKKKKRSNKYSPKSVTEVSTGAESFG